MSKPKFFALIYPKNKKIMITRSIKTTKLITMLYHFFQCPSKVYCLSYNKCFVFNDSKLVNFENPNLCTFTFDL